MDNPAPTPCPRRKWLHRVLWVLVVAVVYPVSVLAVVSAYWLKTDHDYNMLKHGGWHAFSRCLVEQIPVDGLQVK